MKRGVRPQHIAFGYALVAVLLGVLGAFLSGGFGLVVVTLPMLAIAAAMFLCAVVAQAAPRTGAALIVGLLAAVAGFFAVVERAYDPHGSHRESALRTVGSALENHAFAHAPAAFAALHVVLAVAAAVLLTGVGRQPTA